MMRRGWIIAGALILAAVPSVPWASTGVSLVLERVNGTDGTGKWVRTGDVQRFRVRLNGMGREAKVAVAANPVRALGEVSCVPAGASGLGSGADGGLDGDETGVSGAEVAEAGFGRAESGLAARALTAVGVPTTAEALIAAQAPAAGGTSVAEGTLAPAGVEAAVEAPVASGAAGDGLSGARVCRLGEVSGERAVDVTVTAPAGAEEVVLAAVARMRSAPDGGLTTMSRTAALPVQNAGAGATDPVQTATSPNTAGAVAGQLTGAVPRSATIGTRPPAGSRPLARTDTDGRLAGVGVAGGVSGQADAEGSSARGGVGGAPAAEVPDRLGVAQVDPYGGVVDKRRVARVEAVEQRPEQAGAAGRDDGVGRVLAQGRADAPAGVSPQTLSDAPSAVGAQQGVTGQQGVTPGAATGQSSTSGSRPGAAAQPGGTAGQPGVAGQPGGTTGQPGVAGQTGGTTGQSGVAGQPGGTAGQPGVAGQPGGTAGQPGVAGQPGAVGQPGVAGGLPGVQLPATSGGIAAFQGEGAGSEAPLPWELATSGRPVRDGESVSLVEGQRGMFMVAGGVGVLMATLWIIGTVQRGRNRKKVL
ncbi:hypothetical protein [Nonomuraea aridisoli]|uniref:hypothetical protein n=1 Tax=Nonomuraea aridisoli TaxID=2070368 RepID=UPI0015E8DDF4|nr:hypothetical protein [Nonomuraea aridisoli]